MRWETVQCPGRVGQRLSGIIQQEKHHTFKLRHDWLHGRSPLSPLLSSPVIENSFFQLSS